MDILDEDQFNAMRFISFANRGGNRPKEWELLEWMDSPRPKPAQRGSLIKRGRSAKYRTVGGIFDNPSITSIRETIAGIGNLYSTADILRDMVLKDGIVGRRELIEEEVPYEYGPDIPKETFVEHLIRLGWADKDHHGGLGLTPLGRALLRSEIASESESESYDLVVLDANNDLSYPILVQRLARWVTPY